MTTAYKSNYNFILFASKNVEIFHDFIGTFETSLNRLCCRTLGTRYTSTNKLQL